jgi:copper transport protein
LTRAEPVDGSVLRKPPRQIRLWFSEDVVARFSAAELLDARGRTVARARLSTDSSRPGLVSLALPELRRGVYSLRWTVLSEEDSHVRKGGLVFRVGPGASPAPAGTPEESPLSPLDVVLRWLDLALLLALAGALAVAAFVLRRVESRAEDGSLTEATRRARSRVLGWATLCAAALLVVGLGLLVSQADTVAGDLPGDAGFVEVGRQLLVDSRWGALWLAREGILLLLVAALVATRWVAAGALFPLTSAAALAVALVAVHVLGGHAAAAPDAALTVAAATLHVLAAALWIGGLAALVIALAPELRRAGPGIPALARASLRPFGALAALSVGVLVATGLFYAGRQVASLDALVTTLYGQVLMTKTALVLAVGAVGLATAMLLRPSLAAPLTRLLGRPRGWTPVPARRLRTLLLAETGLGLAVLATAGFLAAAVPARGPEFAPAPDAAATFRSQTVDDLLVSVSVKPALPGPNVFEVLAASTRRPAPGPIERVSLRFTDPNGATVSAPMRELEPGRYRLGGAFLATAGAWHLAAVVERAGLEETVAGFEWPVVAAGPRRAVLVSDRPLEPVLTRASVAAFAALLVAVAWLALRRALPTRRPAPGLTHRRLVRREAP